MKGGLIEIRIKAQEGIARVFYGTLIGKRIVILHSVIKKTQKVPPKDLELARVRLADIKSNKSNQ